MTKISSVLAAAAIAAGAAGFATVAIAQTRYYDQLGQFRGYAWCKKRGMDIVDCNYYTAGQCQASGPGYGPAYCVPNPFIPRGEGRSRRRNREY